MIEMNTAKRLLLWLAVIFTSFLPASALAPSAPENHVWEIFSIGYDAPVTEATGIGNRTETSTSAYDTAPIYRATIEEIPTEANRSLFDQIAEFKAAEGGGGSDLYAFGNRAGPRAARPAQDFGVSDSSSIVGPEAPPLPAGASTFSDVSQAPLSGHYHVLPAGTELPEGLGVTPDGIDVLPGSPHGPGHNTIYPTRPMTVDEFNDLFTNLPWQYGGKK